MYHGTPAMIPAISTDLRIQIERLTPFSLEALLCRYLERR